MLALKIMFMTCRVTKNQLYVLSEDGQLQTEAYELNVTEYHDTYHQTWPL